MISVFIVDDHLLIRAGLAELIGAEADMNVTGDAASPRDALSKLERLRPDVALLDISLGDEATNGIELCRQIHERHPGIACVMLTSVTDDRARLAAKDAGAVAYTIKSVGSTSLVDTIRTVASGAVMLDNYEANVVRRRLNQSGDGLIDDLTAQERRIFDLLGSGCSNRQIADELFLAEKTVKNYVTSVLSKLGLSRRTEVAALAARLRERESQWRT